MDLATYFCVICGVVMAQTDVIWPFFSFEKGLACDFIASIPLHPYRSACGINYGNKNITYLKWQAIQLSIQQLVYR